MQYNRNDLGIVSKVNQGWAEGKHPDATEVCYSCNGMDITEAEYCTLLNVLARWECEMLASQPQFLREDTSPHPMR
jgi:hypothetical protein